MNRLKARIVTLIETEGPMSVSDYMALCLFDPRDGYYTNRQPFGADGDFVTAPEISQMFGELIAVWLYSAWNALGRPMPVTIAEIGPGRGTLMADMLRTLARLEKTMIGTASFAMVEASPRLADVQKRTLANAGVAINWHETIASLPATPLLIVGNELFDAIPVRQFVRTRGGWRERTVAVGDDQALRFAAGLASVDPGLLPVEAATAPEGAIVELAPARSAMMSGIAERIARYGGAGLFIDYGHLEPGVGDTLQAVRKHKAEDALANPGEADLTSHVDFAALAATARLHGLDAHLGTQGDFLLAMGLLERAGQLGADAGEAGQEGIAAAVERLAGPDAMGTLFKVLGIAPPGIPLPAFSV